MQLLPAYFYRTTLLTLDDDTLFSSTIAALLAQDFAVKTFNSPEKLLDYIASYQRPQLNKQLIRDCSEHDHYDTAQHSLVDIDITALHTHAGSTAKQDEISIIISDYDMPNMCGVDVFKQLTHIPAKKILLTGAADQQIAIDAFNANVIDRYIRKDNTHIAQEIKKHVHMLVKDYFNEQSRPLLNHLEAHKTSPLTDPVFVTFFNQWCQENHIKQFSLIDKNGSYHVIDQNHQSLYFILHTDSSLDAFMELNDEETEAAHHLTRIADRSVIPFFGIGVDSWNVEVKDWDNYLHAAQTIPGREKYYWCVVKG